MTCRISFYPSVSEGGFNRVALALIASKVLRPSVTIEAKTIPDIQRAMAEAARFAADIPLSEVAALMPLSDREKAAGATHNVYVCLSWIAKTRKPNGFNARKWEGYVRPCAGAHASPLEVLRHHVTGAIERGEGVAIVEQPAPHVKA